MLANDPTGQLARERVAEFHRRVECQRLEGLARRTVVAATAGGVGGGCWPIPE